MLALWIVLTGSVAISSFLCGHEVGIERFRASYEVAVDYASLLEEQNSNLNKQIRKLKEDKR